MPVKSYKPTSPGMRQRTTSDFSEITRSAPEKSLTKGKLKTGGRDSRGHFTSWWRGGGHKKRYRDIDFKRDKRDIPAKVASIEYDPNRSARIALLAYADGEKRYIVAPAGLAVGLRSRPGPTSSIVVGNALPLKAIPVGIVVHNVEFRPTRGGQLARSAGAGAHSWRRKATTRSSALPSGEMRRVGVACCATVGKVGNLDHSNITIGKAGRNRWLGWKSHNRGSRSIRSPTRWAAARPRPRAGAIPSSPWGKCQGPEYPQQQGGPTPSSSAPQVGRGDHMSRSTKKGPFIDAPAPRKDSRSRARRRSRSRPPSSSWPSGSPSVRCCPPSRAGPSPRPHGDLGAIGAT